MLAQKLRTRKKESNERAEHEERAWAAVPYGACAETATATEKASTVRSNLTFLRDVCVDHDLREYRAVLER